MKNKKVVLTSVLSLATCASIVAGATYALFTSETETNISINSGKVEVFAEVTDLALYSQENIDINTKVGTHVDVEGNVFPNGGTAKYEEGTLSLDRLTPGDGVTFNVSVTNKSNVAIKYRTVISDAVGSSFLMDALEVEINDAAYYGAVAGEWKSLEAEGTIAAIPVSIELPTSVGNEYQGLEVGISISVEAIQGNAVDNTASVNGTAYETFAEAIAAAKSGDTVEVSNNAIVQMPANVADGVTVKGATFNTPVVVTNATAAAIAEEGEASEATSAPVVFEACTFKNNALLSVADRNVKLTGCKFVNTEAGANADGDMPYVYQKSGDATVTVENTTAEVTVYTADKWVEMAKVLNSRTVKDDVNKQSYLTVKLGADLDFTGVADYQIGTLATTLDGQGYTLSNLNTNLFGTVSGTVKNLNIENVDILNTAKGGANGFIGTVADGGLVDNCKVSGVDIQWTGTIKDMTDGFGGVICSVSAGATVQSCAFSDISVTTYGKTKRTGGVFDGISGTVKDCVFNDVKFTVVDKDGVDGYLTSYGGGFAAVVNGGAVVEDCEINNMQVNVDDGGHLGGVFGKAHISGQTAPITLKNITVNGLTMNVGNAQYGFECVAGFIAQPDSRNNDVRVAIDNCHIYGLDMTLTGPQGESAAAGFISGLCGGVDVTNCSVEGKIDGTNTPANIGGFIGDAGWYGSIEQNFTNCVADVDVTVKNGIGGGFIAVDGTLSGGTATLNLTSCKANGTVTVADGGTGTVDAFCGKTIE